MRAFLFCVLAISAMSAFAEDHAGGNAGRGRATAPAVVQANRFNVTRPLGFYGNRLGEDFLQDLARLRADGHWIDGGSGEGVAIEHYHQLGANDEATAFASDDGLAALNSIARLPANQRAHVTGITFHMNRPGRRTYNHRLRHLVGRLMEDIPDEEIGRADLISDVYGVFAYSNRLDVAMKKYLTALKPNGKLYVFTDHMDRTTIREGGREISVMDWLNRITGIRIEQVGSAIRITKTGQPITIPSLFYSSGNDQTPPARRFKLLGATITVPGNDAPPGAGADFTVRHRYPVQGADPLSPETQAHLRRALGYDPMERD